MSAKPFVHPDVVKRLSESSTDECTVIITCNEQEGATSYLEPPVANAKPLGKLPGLFTAVVDARALEALCKIGNVAAIELDREEYTLD